jgi:hypothetical protein
MKIRVTVINIYRSPSSELDKFSGLHAILDQLIIKGRSIISMGDFSININNKEPMSKQLTDITNNFNLTLTIAKPIQVTDKTTTETDQIMIFILLYCVVLSSQMRILPTTLY